MLSPVLLLCACILMVYATACTPGSKKISAEANRPKNEVVLTVVRHIWQDSLHTDSDTLIHSARIDVNKRPVNLYFCRDSLHLPLILPSGGFMRNKAQEKECNWEMYPATVRCCTYDSLGHVVSMSVNNAEATQEWRYSYDDMRRIVECKGWWSACRTEYDNAGRIARLMAQRDGRQEEYDFAYAQ